MTEKKSKPKPKRPFGKRVQIHPGNGARTKQSFKDDCDINKIMSKYERTGMVSHLNSRKPSYGYASSASFTESMAIVVAAHESFEILPSEIRAKFANSPELFLKFCEDPANRLEMAQMGLLSDEVADELLNPKKEPEKAPETARADSPAPDGE